MKNRKKKSLYLLLYTFVAVVLGCATPLSAQTIATDFNNCTHGVKDYSGNWIIQPVYDLLERDDCGYIVSKGGLYGVIDPRGRTLIPELYDYLYPLYNYDRLDQLPNQYYVVQKNGLSGLVDTSNRIIIPILYEDISGYEDTTIVAREGTDTWYFFNVTGTQFTIPYKSKYRPSMLLHHRYSVSGQTLFRRRSALVGDSGQVILPLKYKFFEGHEEHDIVTVVKGNKYGYCSAAGKMLWPLSFTYKNNASGHVGWMQYLGDTYAGPAQVGNKMGLITVHGDTLLPFIYDDISPFDTYPSHGNVANLWLVSKDGLSGIYDDRNGWKIPVSCTNIETFRTYFSDGDSSKVGVLVYEMNNRWGVKTTAGQEILSCVYEEMIHRYSDEYIFLHGDTIMYLSPISTLTTDRLVNQYRGSFATYANWSGYSRPVSAPSSKQFSAFQGKENVITYYNPTSTHKYLVRGKDSIQIDNGNYYHFTVPDTILVAGCFFTQMLTQPALESKSIRVYHLDNLSLHSAYTNSLQVAFIPGKISNKLSMVYESFDTKTSTYYVTRDDDVFKEDGQVIASGDSVIDVQGRYSCTNGNLYFNFGTSNAVENAFDTTGKLISEYLPGVIGEYSDKYVWRYLSTRDEYDWKLFDRYTGQLKMLPGQYSDAFAPIWDSITIISNMNGLRLFNIATQRFLTVNGFNKIIPLTIEGSLFAVKTCKGNMGIINAGGKWVSDTVFTAFTPSGFLTNIEGTLPDFMNENSSFYSHYIFSNDSAGSVLFAQTAKIESTNQCTQILWSQCVSGHHNVERETDLLRYGRFGNREFVHFNFRHSDSVLYQPWHKQCITDTLFCSRRYTPLPDYFTDPENAEYEYSYEYGEYQNCTYCRKKGFTYQAFNWTHDACYGEFAASHVSDSVLSFSSVSSGGSLAVRLVRRNFSNVFLFPDGPHCMTIDSLFNPEGEWKTFLINTVLEYVNSHKYVEGDCQNPVGIPNLLSQNWQVEREGIILYPPGFLEGGLQLWIPVSWNALSPYLRDDVKSKLPHSENNN